jgi:hypothetical protein
MSPGASKDLIMLRKSMQFDTLRGIEQFVGKKSYTPSYIETYQERTSFHIFLIMTLPPASETYHHHSNWGLYTNMLLNYHKRDYGR